MKNLNRIATRRRKIESDGYVQPYSDNPLDYEPVSETVYLNLINKAKEYVYINTPYLIIDGEMVSLFVLQLSKVLIFELLHHINLISGMFTP